MLRKTVITEKINTRYPRFMEHGYFTILPNKIINKTDKICCVGSCFAEEIKLGLQDKYNVGPDTSALKINHEIEKIDELPGRQHLNFYNSANIKSELAIAAGQFSYSDDDIFKVNKKNFLHEGKIFNYQDPYRRQVFGETKEDLLNAREKLQECLKTEFQSSDVFIFTLGLQEVTRRKSNDNTLSQYPAYGGNTDRLDCYPHWLTYDEIVQDLREIIKLCRLLSRVKNPEIIFTVSPVPMMRTFSKDLDVVSVNLRAKSILIAATHTVVCEEQNCSYFGSYEMVNSIGKDAFEPDGRHVKREVVSSIVATFENAFVT
jgi:hypothetical protein